MHFSILIPTFNRREPLGQMLLSLRAIDHEPGDHEIIVIDNGSTDDTRALVEREAAARPGVRYLHEPMPGPLSARHRGALEARGEICAFLDDDVLVGREWLASLKESFRDPAVAVVGGPSTPKFATAAPAWLADFYTEDTWGRYCGWLSLVECGDQLAPVDPLLVFGLNYAIRRSTLFTVGGFNPDIMPKPLLRFQGDGEGGLSRRVKAAGLTALYHPRVSVQHLIPASRLSVAYFEERAFSQGVSESFASTRAAGRVPDEAPPAPGRFSVIRRTISTLIRGTSMESLVIKRRTAAAYRAGYLFHQDEVRRDPQLLAWVLRKNYWDYALPEGWERFMSRRA